MERLIHFLFAPNRYLEMVVDYLARLEVELLVKARGCGRQDPHR